MLKVRDHTRPWRRLNVIVSGGDVLLVDAAMWIYDGAAQMGILRSQYVLESTGYGFLHDGQYRCIL